LITRSRNSGVTLSLPFITRETVAMLTPPSLATSWILVFRARCAFSLNSISSLSHQTPKRSGCHYRCASYQPQSTSPQKTLQENTDHAPKSLPESKDWKDNKLLRRHPCLINPYSFVGLKEIGRTAWEASEIEEKISSLLKDFPENLYS
jgi:hypothetical protein